MLTKFLGFASTWGDTASIIGLAVALLGFCLTIIGVWRSKAAAIQARDKVSQAIEQMEKFDVVAELNLALAEINEVKRLQRAGVWNIIPDRYTEIRRRLASVKSSGSSAANLHREAIQKCVDELNRSERRIEQSIAMSKTPANPAKLIWILSTQYDAINGVLQQMRKEYEKS